jgi:large repetitive protein
MRPASLFQRPAPGVGRGESEATVMDYEGTRDTASEVPMGDIALGRPASDLTAAAAAGAGIGGTPLIPDANNTVVLPEGATLDDIAVRGRDLVITTDDGRSFIIPDGAVFVPQIVAQGVTVPPLNLAALLVGQEPEPAAGPVRSSGGNFAVPVDPLQDAYDLGDLLPYTQLAFPEPRVREIQPAIDRKPETVPNAVVLLDDDAVAEAGGNPGGTGDDPDAAFATGTLSGSGGDGALTWALDTAGAPAGFSYAANGTGLDVLQGTTVVLRVTLDPATGAYTVTQLAVIDHVAGSDENNQDFAFSYTVTDQDGDTATGSLAVNVDDDTPIARNDTDSVAAGTYGPESGNVLTGTGTTRGTAGADSMGADTGTLTGFRAGTTGSFTAPGGTIAGTYGTLTLGTGGGYTYVRNPGTPGGVSDVFSYQLTDGDGDTTTATLTIDIGDALPLVAANEAAQLDDDALAGGNPGGSGDDADAANLAGTLNGAGGDGPLTWALGTTGAPAGFTYTATATGLDVFQGETLVLQVTLNPATGAYTVTQVAPIVHTAGGAENNTVFPLSYTVTDQDGDEETGTLAINVDDDTPTVVADGRAPSLVVDESSLSATATQDFSGLFSHSFGADGAGSIAYALDVTAGPSGLVDSLSGESVVLSISGGVAEGRTVTGNLLVFTASVDADGNVTLTQSRAVIHDPNAGPNDVETLLGSLITLTQTVTDSDGDPASATANIGGLLNFVDDAPTASNDTDTIASGTYGPATGNVLTDASAGDADDGDSGADALGNDGGSVTAVSGAGGAGTIGGTTTGAHGVLTLNDDGSYSYTRDPGTPGGVTDTFLYTVTDGDGDTAQATLIITIEDAQPVTAANALVQLDDDALAGGNPGGTGDVDPDTANLTGTLAASGGDGPLAWSLVSLSSSVGLSGSLVNPGLLQVFQGATLVMTITIDNATGAYTVTQNAPIDHAALGDENNASVSIDYQVIDQDGDFATGTLTIDIDDDTPTVTANALVRLDDDTFGGNADGNGDDANSLNAVGTLGHSFGADGGTVAFTTSGAPAGFSYVASGTGINVFQGATQVLAITLDPATGAYSVVQTAPINHPAGGDENNQLFTLSYTVTDGDGDIALGSLSINVDDDTPIALTAATSGTVDEDGLPGGNTAAATGDVAGAALSASGSVTGLFAAGADVPLTYSLSAVTTSLPALTSGGTAVSYTVVGNVLTATAGASTVFTLTLNGATGQWDFVLSAQLDHAAGLSENDIEIDFGGLIVATDNDGDSVTATGNLIVTIDDDTQLLANDSDTIASGTYGPATGNILTDVEGDGGADSLGADGGALTAITGFGGAGAINGTTTGQYGVLTLGDDGSYSYTRNPGTPGGVTDTFTYTVTDGDGDVATATLIITIEDARPLTTPNALVQLDDETLAGGNPGGSGDVDPDTANLTGTVSGAGGDGPLTYELFGVGLPAGGFTTENPVPGTVLIKQGGVTVLTVTLDAATGAYAVVQNAPIDHAAGGAENNLQITINYRVLDQDGDNAIGALTIDIDDDTPVLANDSDAILSGSSAPATGNVLTDNDPGDAGDSDDGADSVGADGGTITAIANSNGVAGTVGGTTAGLYGTLTLNLDGSYSYTRTAGTPGNAEDVFTYTVTDGDGDVATATLTIVIEDARPLTTPNAPVQLDDDALAGGNPGGSGDVDPDTANLSGTLSGAGGDGALTWALLTTGAPAGFSYVATATGINVLQGATLVMQVTLVPTTGAYTVTQVAAIDHTAGGDENNQPFTLNYTVTDADGDFANGTLAIDVDDDTPTVTANALVRLDDDTFGGNADGNGDDANSLNAIGTLGHSFGADGGSIAFATSGAPAGFSYVASGTGINVFQGAVQVLAVTLNPATGAYTVTQTAPIVHAAGLDENNQLFSLSYSVTDGDGDTAGGTLTINVDDDTPIALAAATSGTVDEDGLPGGNTAAATGDVAGAALSASGSVTGLFSAGADVPLAYSLSAITTSLPALTSGGTALAYTVVGNVLTASAGAATVFTLTLNATTGQWDFVLSARLDHAAGLSENDIAIDFGGLIVATDRDGDSVTATGNLIVTIDDDTQLLGNDSDTIASGTYGPATGNILTDASAGDAGDSDSGADSFGADGGSLTAITGFGGAGSIGGITIGQYGVLTLQPGGGYSYTRNPGTPGGVSDTFTYTVTDGDGDTTTATLIITIVDALPLTTPNALVQLDDDALAGGIAGGTGDVDPDTANLTGTLAASGGDGPLSWALLTSGAPAGFSYVANGTGINVLQGSTVVLQVTLDTATGGYTVAQVAPIVHSAGSDENNQPFTLIYRVTDLDGDFADGTLAINVDDDTPTATATGPQPTLVVDETLLGSDATASFAGVFATAFGADGAALAGSTVYSLGINAGASGLVDVATGAAVVLTVESGQVVGRAGAAGPIVFTLSVAANGDVTLDQQRAVQHNDPLDHDEAGASAAVLAADNLITLTATVTDRDGDQASATANIGSNLQFEDDGPAITAVTSPLAIANSGFVSGTGDFVFTTGNDGAAGTDDAIKTVTFGGTVNGVAVTNPVILAGTEDAATANFSFSFTYSTGTASTATATGTLVFDKALGTYTVDLDAPIQSFTISGTASGTAFLGYELNSADPASGQPPVSVTQISPSLFLQFTGVAEPGSGTGANNLGTVNYGLDGSPPNDGTNLGFSNGELFNQAAGWVSVSNTANGVNGDTIGGGEVLDFNLYTSNPQGFVGQVPSASTTSMYLKFDGIGTGEDFIMLLKLWNPTTGEYTTRAIMVENSDIQKGPGAGPGMFAGITLDNNDGLIVIEANDYNQAGENFVIVGAQIAGSDEGISGSAYNFNNATGALGGSTTDPLQAFSTDIGNGPMKISDIGFVTTTSTAQPAQLTFDVTVQDRDGDTDSETLVVNVGSAPVPAEPLSTKSTTTATSAERLSKSAGELLAASTAAGGLLAAMALDHTATVDTGLAPAAPELAVTVHSALPEPAMAYSEASTAGLTALEPAFAAEAPVVAEHLGGNDDGAALRSVLDTISDRFADAGIVLGGDNGKSALFGDAMDALMAPGAFAATAAPALPASPAIAAALADSADAHAVDSIVDHFAGAASESPEQLGHEASIGFDSLLQLSVSGGGAEIGGIAFGAMLTIDHDEQAAAMA